MQDKGLKMDYEKLLLALIDKIPKPYHQWSKKHLQKYVNEFVYRQNVKDLDAETKTLLATGKFFGHRLKYKELIK